jgi:HK97 gp10 family phage protein
MEVQLIGDQDIINKLKKMQDYLRLQMMQDISKTAKEWYEDGFAKHIYDDGGRKTENSKDGWAPRTKDYNWPTLNNTGKLKNSLGHKITGYSVEIFTNVKYAKYLNFGTDKMVAREFIGLSLDLNKLLIDIIEKKLGVI